MFNVAIGGARYNEDSGFRRRTYKPESANQKEQAIYCVGKHQERNRVLRLLVFHTAQFSWRELWKLIMSTKRPKGGVSHEVDATLDHEEQLLPAGTDDRLVTPSFPNIRLWRQLQKFVWALPSIHTASKNYKGHTAAVCKYFRVMIA